MHPALLVVRPTFLLTVMLIVSLDACRGHATNPIVEATVDSLGNVPVDTISEEALNAVPKLRAEQSISLGGDRSDATRFSEFVAVEYDSTGQLFVSDRLAHNVRVYDRTGKLIRTIGRRGGGPGEFNYPDHVLLKNDTLLVTDRTSIHFLKPDGSYITRAAYQMNFQDPKWGPVGIAPQTFDIIPQGLVTSANLHVMAGPSKTPRPDTISLFFMSLVDGSIQKPFMQIVSNNYYQFVESGHALALFAPEPHFAVTSDGRVVVNARDGEGVDFYKDGIKQRRLLINAKKREVTSGDIDSLVERSARRLQEWIDRPLTTAPKDAVQQCL
jgi:hypothetical protein